MPKRTPSSKYLARARAFADAVDIGITTYGAWPPPPDEHGLAHPSSVEYEHSSRELASQALDPEPPFANLKSLAYLEDAFFTFWNESSGAHVEPFWAAIAQRELPFQRKEVIGEVLRRGRIRTAIEYDHVQDSIVVLEQSGRISAGDARRLSEMLAQYESRSARGR